MIWADRVALVLLVLLSPVILFSAAQGMPVFAALVVFVAWLVMRGLDFIFMGQIRRRRNV